MKRTTSIKIDARLASRWMGIVVPQVPTGQRGIFAEFFGRKKPAVEGEAAATDAAPELPLLSEAAEAEVPAFTDAEKVAMRAEAASLMEPVDQAVALGLTEQPLWRPELRLPVHTFLSERTEALTDARVAINPNVFLVAIRRDVLHRAVVWHLACLRQGTAFSRTRGEVAGSTRKLRPQKGQGRARVGSIRAPHFRHGGVAHGPKNRDWSYALPSKVQSLALRMALSLKLAQGKLLLVENLRLDEAKTGQLARRLADLTDHSESTLVVDAGAEDEDAFDRASANLPRVERLAPMELSVYEILRHDRLVLTLDSLVRLERQLSRHAGPGFFHWDPRSRLQYLFRNPDSQSWSFGTNPNPNQDETNSHLSAAASSPSH